MILLGQKCATLKIFQDKNISVSIQEKSYIYALIWNYENNAFGVFVVIISGNLATAEIIAITCTETNITFMDTQKKNS